MGCKKGVKSGGVCATHGAKRYKCVSVGCTNHSIRGGLCVKHGTKGAHRHAALMDANKSVNGGVCQRHGAVVKRCRMEGCRNQVVKGGVCIRHGAKRESSAEYCIVVEV